MALPGFFSVLGRRRMNEDVNEGGGAFSDLGKFRVVIKNFNF